MIDMVFAAMIKRLLGWSDLKIQSTNAPLTQEEGPYSSQVYLEAARHFLDIQRGTLDSLSTKSAQFLSVASLALPVTYALLRPSADSQPIPIAAEILLFVALGAYGFVLFFAVLASNIRALEFRPNITTLKGHSENYGGIYLTQWVANEYEASISQNVAVLTRKARLVGAVAFLFFVEALCLSIAAVVVLL